MEFYTTEVLKEWKNMVKNSLMLKIDENKAVYTAALVADGWAGAENLEKTVLWPTNGRTDRPTDGPTEKWLIESRVRD